MPNLRHLCEPLRGREGLLLETVGFKKTRNVCDDKQAPIPEDSELQTERTASKAETAEGCGGHFQRTFVIRMDKRNIYSLLSWTHRKRELLFLLLQIKQNTYSIGGVDVGFTRLQ